MTDVIVRVIDNRAVVTVAGAEALLPLAIAAASEQVALATAAKDDAEAALAEIEDIAANAADAPSVINKVNKSENGADFADPTAVPGNIGAAEVGKVIDNDLSTLAAIKAKPGNAGDLLMSSVYGGAFELGSPAKMQSSTITQDDELFQVTASSGTWQAKIGSMLGDLRVRAAVNRARVCSKIAMPSSLPDPLVINVPGDSTVYGQAEPPLTGGDRIPTGFGDGSLHVWSQVATPWPAVLQARLIDILGTGGAEVNNLGFSGDTLENLYNRHTTADPADITIVPGMINDVLTATNNGGAGGGVAQIGLLEPTGVGTTNESGDYIIDTYVDALFKILSREIIRGSWPFVAIEAPFATSVTGYDGTNWAAARLMRQVAAAARTVAEALDLPVIDFAERLSAYDNDTMTSDGVHPTLAGHEIRGETAAITILGEALGPRVTVAGEALIGVNITRDPVIGHGGVTLSNTANASSFGRPFFNATEAADIDMSPGETVTVFFYMETDEVEIYPVGFVGNGGSGTKTIDLIANFGIDQPPAKLDTREQSDVGLREVIPSTKTISVAVASKHLNHPAVMADHLRIQGRGWQAVTLSSPSSGGATFVLSGFRAGDFGKWYGLELEAGFEQFGDIQPAERMVNGAVETRGVISCAAPTTDDQFITTLTRYSRVTFYDSVGGIVSPWTYVELQWVLMDLLWKSSPGANLVNLATLPPRPVLVLDDA